METNREVAWREPPAAGLAACLYRSTDMMHCSHKDKNMRSCEQYITLLQAQQSAVRGSLNPNSSAHTFSMVPALKTTARKNIMNYVRRGKGKKNIVFYIILHPFLHEYE